MIRLDVTVPDIDEIIAAGYTVLRVYTDIAEDGTFTTLDGTETLVAKQSGYSYIDTDGTTSTWYKVAYYGASPGESSKSDAQQGGTLDAYCTALDVRQELGVGSGSAALSEKHDDVLWDMCVEVSRLIDRYKKVEAGAFCATESETRYVDGSGMARLWLPWPAVSISAVSVEETDGTWTEWDSGDYHEWPRHETPILRLDVTDRNSSIKSVWKVGPERVKLTGVFGVSATVPEQIRRAARIQVAAWFKRAQQGWADVGGQIEMGQLRYTKDLDPTVATILGGASGPHQVRL